MVRGWLTGEPEVVPEAELRAPRAKTSLFIAGLPASRSELRGVR